MKYLFAILLALSTVVNADVQPRSLTWAQPMIGSGLGNFYIVDDGVYRSKQPDDEIRDLMSLGIKEVLSLRNYHSDEDELGESGLILHRVKMNAGSISHDQLIESLRIIKNRKDAILVHCWHGSDRTGAVIAAYRVIFNNWPKSEAIAEMKNGGYGYHESVYPNIVDLISNINVDEYRKRLGL